ncbi:hypothetical protein C8F04DRAFT_1117948 [Mycena alexandri]|uniref:Uncharacterized protein n=1 Tax=Mycena alexandri TaxID=1745969 RepID=A0AAD6SJ30_9AGAR|nr:hypothetical protein C8F04DRAFT_1117948 [Mycena alexandri]
MYIANGCQYYSCSCDRTPHLYSGLTLALIVLVCDLSWSGFCLSRCLWVLPPILVFVVDSLATLGSYL